MSYRATIAALMQSKPKASDADLAKLFLAEADREDLIALITHEVAHQRRLTVIMVENEDTPHSMPRMWSERLRLQMKSLGNGERMSFGRMTVDMHRVKITMLRAHIAGTEKTIALHEQAITDIQAAGVKCLNDLAHV